MGTGAILLIHAAATLAMTGLIWFVQLVHYPLFVAVDRLRFPSFALEHRRRTSVVVVPLMLVEAATAALLLVVSLSRADRRLALLGGFLLVLIWLSTALLQVPLHHRLAAGFDAPTVRRLVHTNWLRTIAWTLRSLIALHLIRV